MRETEPGSKVGKDVEPGKALESKTAVKDSWFSAYLEGNASVPQVNNGIDIYLANAVLHDMPVDWRTFAESQFSPEQISRVGEIMTRVHAGFNIPHAAEGQQHHFKSETKPQLVDSERLHKLWTATRNNAIRNLYTSLIPYYATRGNTPNPIELDTFFIDPKNTGKIATLREVVKVMKEAFKDKRIQSSLKTYRESLMWPRSKRMLNLLAAELGLVIQRELVKKGLEIDDPNVERVLNAFEIPIHE